MSIAVSATLRPARTLMLLSAAMTLAVSFSAAIFWLRPNDFIPAHARLVLALVCVIAALAAFFVQSASQKIFRVDISASGQIWLTHTTHSADSGIGGIAPAAVTEGGESVSLLGDSTLWSNLMLLRLRTSSGQIRVLIVLPGSLDRRSFRALFVACRWITLQALPHSSSPNDKPALVA